LARTTQRKRKVRERQSRRFSACAGTIVNQDGVIDISLLRRLFGGASKFTLPKQEWSFSGQIILERTLGAADLAQHDALKPMIRQFCLQDVSYMSSGEELIDCMKELVRFARGLDNPRCKVRRRKARLTRLRKYYFRFLRNRANPNPLPKKMRKDTQGLRLFAGSIKKQFLG